MKVYRKYLEELQRSINRLLEEMKQEKSTVQKSPLKLTLKPAHNCEITVIHNTPPTNKNKTACDQELSSAQKKCREVCEIMEMLSKFSQKYQYLNY